MSDLFKNHIVGFRVAAQMTNDKEITLVIQKQPTQLRTTNTDEIYIRELNLQGDFKLREK